MSATNNEGISQQAGLAAGDDQRRQAEELYQQGNAHRKTGNFHEAINCYIEAARLDPDSPATEAKRMLDDIMAFYCKDMYNP